MNQEKVLAANIEEGSVDVRRVSSLEGAKLSRGRHLWNSLPYWIVKWAE